MKFVVIGEPVAQGRPRLTTINGRSRAYDPAKSREWKEFVANEIWFQMKKNKCKMITGACILTLKVYRSIPTSYSKKKTDLCQRGLIRPEQKPDLSNYVKGVEDALNDILWKDDSLIVGYGKDFGKYFVEKDMQPCIVIEVEELKYEDS